VNLEGRKNTNGTSTQRSERPYLVQAKSYHGSRHPDFSHFHALILTYFHTERRTVTLRNQIQIHIGCPTSSVAQANLTIKINFNILHSFSSSDILIIYLHVFLQSLHPFEKNCVEGLPQDFRQDNPNTNKKFRWSFSAISQLSFDLAKKEKYECAKSGE
jgi:hypothetical protein